MKHTLTINSTLGALALAAALLVGTALAVPAAAEAQSTAPGITPVVDLTPDRTAYGLCLTGCEKAYRLVCIGAYGASWESLLAKLPTRNGTGTNTSTNTSTSADNRRKEFEACLRAAGGFCARSCDFHRRQGN